ncbi:MAG: MerR family transcriptional regulator, partial [Bryobacteraceae bacterium]
PWRPPLGSQQCPPNCHLSFPLSQDGAYSNYRVKRMNTDGALSIGTLARAAGVKVVTIRFYERIRLMPEPPRTEGNYRAYGQEHLHRLRFVRRCRDLGFTIDQIRELLRFSSQVKSDCSGIDRITAKHLEDIERKVADLKRLAAELRRINSQCRASGPIAECRILEALSPDSMNGSCVARR